MKNIKVSNTFSALTIIIVVGVFLLPSLISGYKFKKEADHWDDYALGVKVHDAQLMASIEKLGDIDLELKKCIEMELFGYKGIPIENGGISNVFQIKRLTCSSRGVHSINGIEQLKSLEVLDLSRNPFTNIELLSKLDKLKYLDLSGIDIGDLGILNSFKSLETLRLPNVGNFLCAEVRKLIASVTIEFIESDFAKETCKGDPQSEYARNGMADLSYKKRLGQPLSKDQQKKLLIYEINKKQKNYNKKYRQAK